MITIQKKLFIISLLLLINPVFAQISDESLKINPLLELYGFNAKTLELKGNVTQMHEQQFSINAKGNITGDSELINNFYKFYTEGSTKEFEQNYKYLLSKKHFFSYTNKGYISHIDIETVNVAKDKDTTSTDLENETQTPDFSTADYKYVQKKNILYKGEEVTEGSSKKTTTRKEYFYHFNDENQVFQIDYQSTDLSKKFIYDSNALVKEMHTFKSGILSHKSIYKYDRNNRLINIATINSDNNTKYPNREIVITYKLDEIGNVIEKKMITYLYSPEGTKEFLEGFLNLYNYTYL
ncbi:MAG TPA: hypothetical protein VFS71_18555 [Flavobacterium sp.]|uniref:hypothetical protein n=1 Tax=Flavobacterium sp. TaxID=239 RepID=UPI002DB5EC6D|nr:hypothetical protein [Flavobacterium sp.]HEU4791693.1 hypothetical protein [Flavobacterium sp.]